MTGGLFSCLLGRMAAITWDDVVAMASGLSAVDADAQTAILDFVNNSLNVAKLYDEDSRRLKMIRVMLAAHFGEVERRKGGAQGVSGAVSAETVSAESYSIDYAQTGEAVTSNALQSTEYGRQYLGMVRSSPARVPFAL